MPSCPHVGAPCVLQSLDKALKSALRSDLEDTTLALLMTPAHFDAYLLRRATKVHNLYLYISKCRSLTVTVHFTGLLLYITTAWDYVNGLSWQCRSSVFCSCSYTHFHLEAASYSSHSLIWWLLSSDLVLNVCCPGLSCQVWGSNQLPSGHSPAFPSRLICNKSPKEYNT